MEETLKGIDIKSFENTEIAFKSKSDLQLRKAGLLFKAVNHPFLSNIATSLVSFSFKIGLPISPIIKRTVFEHFCGGETIEDSEKTIRQLDKFHVKTILDYSVEGGKDEMGFDATMAEIIRTIEKASHDSAIPFSVFKVSGIADVNVYEKVQLDQTLSEEEEVSYKRSVERIDLLCKTAFENNVPVYVDAEDSWYQETIDQIVYQMMAKYNKKKAIVWNTYQMYKKHMVNHLDLGINMARESGYYFGAKLVRGAYMEKERERAEEMGYADPIQPDKESTDREYNNGLRLCIENLDVVSVCCASHNDYSNMYLTQLMDEYGVLKEDERVYFAQLYGMSDNISFNLADANYNVAKYVPYGEVKYVMPYLLRRADENTSVAGQSSRELLLLQKEIARRKNR